MQINKLFLHQMLQLMKTFWKNSWIVHDNISKIDKIHRLDIFVSTWHETQRKQNNLWSYKGKAKKFVRLTDY